MFFWSFGQRNIGLSIQKKVANDQKWSKENIIYNFQKGTEATPTLKFILIFLTNILTILLVLACVDVAIT